MRKAFPIIILFLLFRLTAISQQHLQFSFNHYDMNNGLAAYDAGSIAQDEEGFIWIGTIDGLQRFDGNRFITFRHNPANSYSLPDNYIMTIHYDKNKRLWILFGNGKIGIFNTRNFQFKEVTVKTSDPRMLVSDRALFEDSKGNILYFFPGRDILTLNEAQDEFTADYNMFKLPSNFKVWSIKEDLKTGKLYIGCDAGFVVYDPLKNKTSYTDNNAGNEALIGQLGELDQVSILMIDSKQRLWFQRWQSGQGYPVLYCYDLVNNILIMDRQVLLETFQSYHELKKMIEQKDSTIWLTGLATFARYQESKKSFQPVYNGYVNDQSIYYQRVNDIFEDRENNLWVATSNNGVYVFNPKQQLFYSIPHLNRFTQRQGDGNVLSFAHTGSGEILVGTWGDGIYKYDSSFNRIPINIRGLDENNAFSGWSMIHSITYKETWIGLQPGVMMIDEEVNRARTYNPAMFKNNTIRQVAMDHRGNVWIGTQRAGLFKWVREKGKKKFEDGFEKYNAIAECRIQKIYTDKKGFIWICTVGEGIIKIDPVTGGIADRITDKGPTSKRLKLNDANSIIQYNDSIMLIAANGLHIYNTRSNVIRQVALSEKISLERIMSMETDANNFLWVSLINGLCRINLDNNSYLFFDRKDGMINDHFNFNASLRLPDNRMLFGSSNSFIVFHPSKILFANRPRVVTITDFKVNNRSLLVDSLKALSKIELSHLQNSIVIEFAALNFLNEYPIYFQLDKIDKEWQKANDINQAVYNYLPAGDYTFRVKAVDETGATTDKITELHIKVRAPFWKTWWFLGIAIFVALGIIYWLDRQRLQKLRATESIRTRIATSLTEDMSNSLSSINISSELAKTKVDTDKERTRDYIEHISETSNRMVQAMYDMVWSIHPNNDTMKNTLERMKDFAIEMESLYNIDIIFDIDEAAVRLDLDMEFRYELMAIFKEAIWNAVKHSEAKHIQVSIRIKKDRFFMFIEDDGKGFDISTAVLARGINDMRRRANAINANFYIESSINTGTVVKVEMKV